MNVVSRLFEFQADAFGVSLGKGQALKEALLTLDRENKGPPNVDPLCVGAVLARPLLPHARLARHAVHAPAPGTLCMPLCTYLHH
jgi:Zn-dependent protease with chaperone function